MRINHQRLEGKFRFFIEGKTDLAPDAWSLQKIVTLSGTAADVSSLVDLVSTNRAEVNSDNSITVVDEDIAAFSSHDIEALGLPEAAQLSLSIKTQGLITAPDFELNYALSDHMGRAWIGVTRDGVILNRGSKSFTLLDPLFTILSKIDQFSELPTDHQSRFSHWAEIAQLLPGDITLDGQLKSLRITSSDRITLDVGPGSNFDPVPLATPEPGESAIDQPVLPEFFLDAFKKQFRKFNTAHKTYALGEGNYLMFPERVREKLNKVREFQQKSEPERRSFIANPENYLKSSADSDKDEVELTEVFVETPSFLSARVKELGQWSPKIGAFVMTSSVDWLPAEDVEILFTVGDKTYQVNLEEVAKLEERVQLAEAQGEEFIKIGDFDVPINEELKAEAGRLSGTAKKLLEKEVKNQPNQVHVPVLFDNIESLEFEATVDQPRRGEFNFPQALKTTSLYEHQKVGLEWLVEHWRAGNPGSLLADDMGLGKTLQTLAYLAWIQETKREYSETPKPHLIVAPTGLLKNWMDEAKVHLHAVGLGDLLEVFGLGSAALKALSPMERKQKLNGAGWVLTTYETLRDQILWFLDIPWSVVAFDEAQKIKNPAARVTEMAKSLKSEFTLMLTGTPVENSLADLWCIMDGAQPGLLGAQKDFVRQYVKSPNALEAGQELKTRLQDEDPPTPMLRRMKEDHLHGLPQKTMEVRNRIMSMTQSRAYDEIMVKVAGSSGPKHILEAIQNLKSVSLMGKSIAEDGLDQEAIESSARLLETLDILDEIKRKGEKVLIFLESIELQKRLVPFLQRRYGLASPPMRISGEINGMLRKSFVDRFQAIPAGEFALMILSPKAGGVGLTLTAANHVIHLSRWWNPAVEDQCTDRVYRIGQKKPVTVWYPIATHPKLGEKSFDWNLHKLLEKKRALSKSALIGQVDASDIESLLGESVVKT